MEFRLKEPCLFDRTSVFLIIGALRIKIAKGERTTSVA